LTAKMNPRYNKDMTNIELIRFAEQKLMVKLSFVEQMTMGCILLTNSGGRKRYVAGILDSGKPFVEKCSENFWENQ